ncbi:MAG: insulinase family protein [Bacteroidia bacterium]|nr:MAG: insulinase family protein [Bacteroidia bacterium]
MPDRTQPPSRQLIAGIPYIKPLGAKLGNGLPVYFLEGGTEEFVKIDLVFFAGSFFQNKPLVSFATTRLLRSGTSAKSRLEINELLDYYSAHLQLDAQKDIVSVSMYVLNKHLEPTLALLAMILQDPVFPEDEMRTFLKNQQQIHIINQKKVDHLARTYFGELVYGEQHPYGYRLKPENFDMVEREDLLAFHQRWFTAGNAFCIVSGRLPAKMEKMIATHLGNLSAHPIETAKPPQFQMLTSGSRKVKLEMPEALQSAIRIGKQLFNRTHPAFHRFKIANALLGGYFGSRLMQNIRQEKGYTYGITSNIISLVRSGYFFIATQVGADVSEAAREEIYRELKNLREKPATPDEMESLKNYLSGSFLRSFDGPFSQAERFKELLVFGLDHSHYDEYLQTLKTITPELIMATAADYLNEDGMMEVVAGRRDS